MNVLVFNVGSSSVKAVIYSDDTAVHEIHRERIQSPQERQDVLKELYTHIQQQNTQLNAIAHRVVHGGPNLQDGLITKETLAELEKVKNLAPLHDIPEIQMITYAAAMFTDVKQFAFYDTSFHQSMPLRAKQYALPKEYYEKGIRRYGFHGISHEFVTKDIQGKVISCHLGSGASVTAVYNGQSMDTSMGFTPLEGVIMGTRSGNLDPGIILYLQEHEHMTVEQINELLNKKSGLLGLSGASNDVRDLLKLTTPQMKQALDDFCYSVAKYIGAYAAALNGVDTIIFTAGVGEGSWQIRDIICKYLGYLGVVLHNQNNQANQEVISDSSSRVSVLVKHTDEQQAMYEKTLKLLNGS